MATTRRSDWPRPLGEKTPSLPVMYSDVKTYPVNIPVYGAIDALSSMCNNACVCVCVCVCMCVVCVCVFVHVCVCAYMYL